MMAIQTVLPSEQVVSAYPSRYLYDAKRFPELALQTPEPVEVDGPLRVETLYQYRYLEGWEGDVPLSMTYMVAERTYTRTKMLFERTASAGGAWWA